MGKDDGEESVQPLFSNERNLASTTNKSMVLPCVHFRIFLSLFCIFCLMLFYWSSTQLSTSTSATAADSAALKFAIAPHIYGWINNTARKFWDKLMLANSSVANKVVLHDDGDSVIDPEVFQNREPKVILTWTPFFDKKDWIPDLREKLKCPVHNCIVTSNKSLISESDAVIFHWRDVQRHNLPTGERPSNQLWLLFNVESPPHTGYGPIEDLWPSINWTVTYRRDSDLYAPYATIEEVDETGWDLDRNRSIKLSNKTKMIAWMVSNCNTPSQREEYVKNLKNYIEIDVYGQCGDKVCRPKHSPQCWKMIENKYKFYLSFENSICKDYVTEKLFQILKKDVIPVVLGGADYKRILPAKYYIDALSFNSPRALAKFLHHVASNRTIYESYLMWKKRFVVKDAWLQWVCKLCEKLHRPNTWKNRPPHITDFKEWWYGESYCRSWREELKSTA